MFVKVSDPGWNVFVKTFLTIKNEIYTIIIIIIHTNMTSFPPSNIIIIHTQYSCTHSFEDLHKKNSLCKQHFTQTRVFKHKNIKALIDHI